MVHFLYIILYLEMSRPGFAYDGYRWENGWPTERTGTLEMEQAPDGEDSARVTGDVNNGTTEGSMDTALVVSIQSHTPVNHQASDGAESTTGYSQVSEEEGSEDEDSNDPGQVSLGSAYAQCKAAREAANRRIVVDISCNENSMVSSSVGGDKVGSMDRGVNNKVQCFEFFSHFSRC
jgi:hypothetical protein